MTLELIKAMAAALLLTIFIESLFAAIMGIKGLRNYVMLLLANVLTNPLVNVIHSYFAYGLKIGGIFLVLLTALLEICAVIAEWIVYKSRTDIRKPFLFSLCANGASFLCGMVINIFLR